MIKSLDSAKHYQWGSLCDGWHLHESESLSVIQERMPPGSSEQRHFHVSAQQVFYVLSGEARFTLDKKDFLLRQGESIHVAPGIIHQIFNNSDSELNFLVISEPRSHGDRVQV